MARHSFHDAALAPAGRATRAEQPAPADALIQATAARAIRSTGISRD
ncbi:hypothetical protein [Amycolatopsis sp. NPDC051102]